MSSNSTGPLPDPDTIPVQITSTVTVGSVVPTYPVIQYGHNFADSTYIGDSISSGYVYRGSRIPELHGKYIFGEITTGQMFFADYAEMLAADDGDPATMATVWPFNIVWDNPDDSPDEGAQTYSTINPGGAVLGPMFQIVERAYEGRGGTDPNLPGGADVTNEFGRADIRIQIDEEGELYILSKSDGMIRAIVGMGGLSGDFNHDGTVDAADYLLWRRDAGLSVRPYTGADADGNGMVDDDDYAFWRNNFGNTAASGAASAAATPAPEPAAALMLALATPLLLWRRRTLARSAAPFAFAPSS